MACGHLAKPSSTGHQSVRKSKEARSRKKKNRVFKHTLYAADAMKHALQDIPIQLKIHTVQQTPIRVQSTIYLWIVCLLGGIFENKMFSQRSHRVVIMLEFES